MSEYQYYEFRAIDRPLNERQMRELRALSSRARITPTSFVNEYNWGDFKGSPVKLMEKYFDAFLYMANWGTRRLMLRLPQRILDRKTVSAYCVGDSAAARVAGDNVILTFESEDDSGDWIEGEGWLASLIPLRAELARGDHRCLYLAWLLCVQNGELDDDETEPCVPPNLRNLSASQKELADFLGIDGELIEAAAERSSTSRPTGDDRAELEAWVCKLPESQKNSLLARLLDDGPHLEADLRLRFAREKQSQESPGAVAKEERRRTVGELLLTAKARAEEKRRIAAEKAAAERARQEREQAAVREKYLAGLAPQAEKTWLKIDTLIATKQPARYDEAVQLLADLRDLAARRDKADDFHKRHLLLCRRHANKPSLLRRMNQAGLGAAMGVESDAGPMSAK